MAPRRSWANNPFWSGHIAIWYRIALDAEEYCRPTRLRRISDVYAIDADVRGQSLAHRLAARRTRSKLVIDALRIWFEAQLPLVPGRSTLAEAIRYALSRRDDRTRPIVAALLMI